MAEKKISKDEQIGFHKGSIQTLIGEQQELSKMLQITQNLIQAHVGELEKLGVKIDKGEKKK